MPTAERVATPGPVQTTLIGLTNLLLMMAGTTWPFVVAVLAPLLREEFDVTATALGLAFGVYYLSASVLSSAVGRFVDVRGFRTAAVVLILISIVQHLLLSGARSWPQLVFSGAVGGAGLALTNPVTNAMVGALLTDRTARNVIGIKQTGVPLSAALAGAVAPVTAAAFGWRGSVLATVLVGTLAGLALLGVAGRGAQRSPRVAGEPAAAPSRRRFGIEWFVLGMGMIASGLNGYLALYLVDAFDGSLQRAGTLIATFALSGALGRIVWATVGGGRRTLPIMRALGTIGGLGLVALALITVESGAWITVVALGATIMAWQGIGMVAIVESGASGSIGAVSARIMRLFFLGFVIGGPLVGMLVDGPGFRAAWAMLAAVAFAAVLSLRLP